MKWFLVMLGCCIAILASGEERPPPLTLTTGDPRPPAAPGFHWEAYEEMHCEIQVPDGWVAYRRTAGLNHAVRISPKPIPPGQEIETGFTLNTIKCVTSEQWSASMKLLGDAMANERDRIEHPIQSSVKPEKDMLTMIIEGERFIPTAPHPEQKYHVRTIARAFPQFGLIYLYSFGAPVSQWEEAWKKGKVMVNPVWFILR